VATPRAVDDRPESPTRFPALEGLRAIAALSVLMTHVAYAGGADSQNDFGPFFARMDAGVAVFFVLSGFLLYRPFLVARLTDRPTPRVVPYLWRRFLRIYPAYWLAMTVIVYVFGDKAIADAKGFVLWYSLMHIYDAKYAFGPLVQSWTLSTEVAFYVFLPIWVALTARLVTGSPTRRIRRELLGIAVLVGVSIAWKAFVLSSDLSNGRIGQLKMWLPWWIDLFAVGMLLAIGSVATRELGRRVPPFVDGRWMPAASWVLALVAFWLVSYGIGMPYASPLIPNHLLWPQHYLYGLTAAFLVLPAVFGPQTRTSSRIRWFLTTRVMVYLGTISYGIYLWHEGWIDRYLSWTGIATFSVYGSDEPFTWATSRFVSIPWFTFVLAIAALTIASASVSWYALERPMLRLRGLADRSRLRAARVD
jgi:peptidoglycan/LPS O-acetylase OafA/YrhL